MLEPAVRRFGAQPADRYPAYLEAIRDAIRTCCSDRRGNEDRDEGEARQGKSQAGEHGADGIKYRLGSSRQLAGAAHERPLSDASVAERPLSDASVAERLREKEFGSLTGSGVPPRASRRRARDPLYAGRRFTE